MNIRIVPLSFAATLFAGAAFAHHGWGSYDVAKAFKIWPRWRCSNGPIRTCT